MFVLVVDYSKFGPSLKSEVLLVYYPFVSSIFFDGLD